MPQGGRMRRPATGAGGAEEDRRSAGAHHVAGPGDARGGPGMTRPAVYMDNHATTRVDPRVVETMLPFFDREYGNAASRTHAFGWRAEEATTRARIQVARLIGADPKEIIFTSGATESNNLAIFGAFEALRGRGDHVITAATEHNAVLDPIERLAARGARVTVLPVDGDWRVDPDDVRRSITG